MKKLNLNRFKARILESKRLKYGGYATVVTIVFIAVLLVVNLLVEQLPVKFDLTRNKLFSLSEQTLDILEKLDRDINIYGLYETGKENAWVEQVINQYQVKTDRIKYQAIAPVRNPGFVKQYESEEGAIRDGSLIVVSGDKFKVIDYYDLVNFQFDQYTFRPTAESLAVEQQITGALLYVTAEKNPVVYTLTGHDEASFDYPVTRQLRAENFELKELNLLTAGRVPEDAELLVINSPRRDLTADELQKIRDYMRNDGRALVLMDLQAREFPNFQNFFASFGVRTRAAVVVEEDQNSYAGNQLWIIPTLEKHSITDPLKTGDLQMLLPIAQVIEETELKKRTLEIEPLLLSSEKSWAKVDLASTDPERKEEDLAGPFTLAVAVVDQAENFDRDSRLILVSNSTFTGGNLVAQVPGNLNFILNCFNWLCERADNLQIRPKSLATPTLFMSGAQAMLFSGLVVILIPLLVLGSGVFVWLRRRNL
ncbi:MAG: GldG family protein [Firmicutes bacterium]|nr:GldG family protein [Bacillota bacterium]